MPEKVAAWFDRRPIGLIYGAAPIWLGSAKLLALARAIRRGVRYDDLDRDLCAAN